MGSLDYEKLCAICIILGGLVFYFQQNTGSLLLGAGIAFFIAHIRDPY